MPTYDYKCDNCGHTMEAFQSITAAPLRKCPECGKSKLKRLIGTGAGLIFKGSGFYETDYRSDSYKQAAASDRKSTESSSSTKTETKTETKKAETKPSSTKAASKKSKN